MIKNIGKLAVIFVVGILGGIFADQILWPYFIERPLFYKYRLEQAPINVVQKEEIYIQENVALTNAIEKVGKAVVGIKTIYKGESIEGSGILITSDGLILSLADIIPQGGNTSVYIEGKRVDFKILKRDSQKNLALLKTEGSNLSTIGFADYGSLRYGQRVFLVASYFSGNDVKKSVNEGIIKTYDEKIIKTNIVEDLEINGSPLFNITGELVGFDSIDAKGNVSATPINLVREFVGF